MGDRRWTGGSRGERGATLTLFAFVTGAVLVMVGSSLMDALTNTYRMSVLRERQAQARALAEGGVVEAIRALEAPRDPAEPLRRDGGGELGEPGFGGGAYAYRLDEGPGGDHVVHAEGRVGEGPDRVHVKLRAVLRSDPRGGGRLRVASIVRE